MRGADILGILTEGARGADILGILAEGARGADILGIFTEGARGADIFGIFTEGAPRETVREDRETGARVNVGFRCETFLVDLLTFVLRVFGEGLCALREGVRVKVDLEVLDFGERVKVEERLEINSRFVRGFRCCDILLRESEELSLLVVR